MINVASAMRQVFKWKQKSVYVRHSAVCAGSPAIITLQKESLGILQLDYLSKKRCETRECL